MSYQVLYRQLRPKTFSDMVGQETVVRTLKNQVMSGNIPHAYLFSGSRGTGKTSAAKILANAVNCLQPQEGDPCGVCKNCIELSQENNLDIIEMDAASNNGVDEIRELREQVKYPPQTGKFKVYIIDEVHMLSTAAFNALLKTLEEPPSHALFVLATTDPQKLPATIISRCQRFEFKRIEASKIVQRLEEVMKTRNLPYTLQGLHLIARSAEGALRDALSLLDMCISTGEEVNDVLVRQVMGTANKELMFSFVEQLINQNPGNALKIIDQLMREGIEAQVFSKDLSYHIRALALSKTSGKKMTDIMEITLEDCEEYIKQGKKVSLEQIMYMLELFIEIENKMRYASSPRILLETVTIKACMDTKTSYSKELEERVGTLEELIGKKEKSKEVDSSYSKKTKETENGKVGFREKNDIKNEGDRNEKSNREEEIEQRIEEKKSSELEHIKTVNLNEESDEIIWKEAMTYFKKHEAAIYGQLSEGRYIGIFENHYQVGFHKKNTFSTNYLNGEERKKVITNCLKELTGKNVGFEAVFLSEASSHQPIKQQGIEQIISDFGRENVQIIEE